MRIPKLSILTFFILLSHAAVGQVAIGTDDSNIDESVMLQVSSENKGILFPQIALTGLNDGTTISSPASSLFVYNTTTGSGLTPGYYYNKGTKLAPVWEALATGNNDGSETIINAGNNITISGSGTMLNPYIINTSAHYIGEHYGGGIVFYIYDGGQHGLIAATSDQSSDMAWWNGAFTLTLAQTKGRYAGQLNTKLIIDNQGQGNYAALTCATYWGGNFGDWYLPSKTELAQLYTNRAHVGGFSNDYYWTSSEKFDDNAYSLDFSTGNSETSAYKNTLHRVRAIRAF